MLVITSKAFLRIKLSLELRRLRQSCNKLVPFLHISTHLVGLICHILELNTTISLQLVPISAGNFTENKWIDTC